MVSEERCAGGCKANRWERLSQTMGERRVQRIRPAPRAIAICLMRQVASMAGGGQRGGTKEGEAWLGQCVSVSWRDSSGLRARVVGGEMPSRGDRGGEGHPKAGGVRSLMTDSGKTSRAS
jgi:hypothetical protein